MKEESITTYKEFMKKVKIQIKSIFGDVLFEYEKENNTFKDTLEKAIKSGADLSEADLSEADLSEVDLSDKEKIRKGKIMKKKATVYKKCRNKIVELELQKGSIVFSINNNKCRTNKAKVISIDGESDKGITIASDYDSSFIYEVGKMVEIEDFDLMYNVECSTGIHFFWTKEEVEKY